MTLATYLFIFGWCALAALPGVVALVRHRPRLALGLAIVGPIVVISPPLWFMLMWSPTDPSYGERAMAFLMEPYVAVPFFVLASVLTFGLPRRPMNGPIDV